MGKLLGALNIGQIITLVLGTVAPVVIKALIPSGDLQTTVLGLVASLLSLLMVVIRKPSATGGTVGK